MIYILLCKDKSGYLQTRLDNRPAHVDYLNALDANGTLRFAGPFLDTEGKPTGSMVAIEAEDEAAARAIADGDPYAKAGLFESVDIRPWNWVFKKPDAA